MCGVGCVFLFGVCGCVLLVCCDVLPMLLYALVLYVMFCLCCVFVLLLCVFLSV